MKRLVASLTIAIVVAIIGFLGFTPNVNAIEFEQDRVAIFGSGNPNGSWVIDSNVQEGVEVGLRAKNRTDGTMPNNGAGEFHFPTGVTPSTTRALWNLEYLANVNMFGLTGRVLSDIGLLMEVDLDPSQGQNFLSYPLLFVHTDSSLGDNTTLNGQGVEDGNFGAWNIAQGSQNITFFPFLGDPFLDATYDYRLSAYELDGSLLASTSIRVVVGEGGGPAKGVPDGGTTIAMLGLVLTGLGLARRKMK